jgi:hypothetical protein
MNTTTLETRFLLAAALGHPHYPAIGEIGAVLQSNESPPAFIESSNYPQIAKMKWASFGLGALVTGGGVALWALVTENSRSRKSRARDDMMIRHGKGLR